MDLGFWSIATLLVCVPFLLWAIFHKIRRNTTEEAQMTVNEWYRAKHVESAAKKGEAELKKVLSVDEETQKRELSLLQKIFPVLGILATLFYLGFYGWLAGFFLYVASVVEVINYKSFYLLLATLSVVLIAYNIKWAWTNRPSDTKKVREPNIMTILFVRALNVTLLVGLLLFAYTAIFA